MRRADAIDQQLTARTRRTRAAQLDGVDGVVGPLLDHLEIEPGAEAAVAAALGDAMRAVVVRGDDGRAPGRRASPQR